MSITIRQRITRKKGKSGRAISVQCSQCGKLVPRDKAIEKRRRSLPLDSRLLEELKKQGARVPRYWNITYYCVSCAKHRRYV